MHDNGPIPDYIDRACDIKQYEKLSFNGWILKATMKDGVLILVNGEVVVLKNIITYKAETLILYQKFCRKRSFYDYPLPSSEINVYVVSNLTTELASVPYLAIAKKCVCMPIKDGHEYVIVPFAHKEL